MTISREYQGGPFVVQCNVCLDTEELEGNERKEAVQDAKRRGFIAHFDGRRWTCEPCIKVTAEQAFFDAEDRYEAYVQSLQSQPQLRAA